MRDSKLYRQYAAECRRIARSMSADQRASLLKIADAWELCAADAEKKSSPEEEEPVQLLAA